MTYRENVQAMCDKLGIANPIREEDLTVKAVSFLVYGDWVRIEGTDMNRAGRLFIQFHVEKFRGGMAFVIVQGHAGVMGSTQMYQRWAEKHFDEIWLDAEEKGRAFLAALKKAKAITVHWK